MGKYTEFFFFFFFLALVLEELRVLFQDMISSPRSSVTPGREVARLTLISPSNEAAIRRRSTISAEKPRSLGEVDGLPVLGPTAPPQTSTDDKTGDTKDETAAAGIEKAPQKGMEPSDGDSEATLISEGARLDQANDKNKENEPPLSDERGSAVEKPSDLAPDPKDKGPLGDESEPVKQAPPLPPRQSPQPDNQKQLLEEVELGAQQDVTEVINNVLFQSQCAIKPLRIESDGEQVDIIKE